MFAVPGWSLSADNLKSELTAVQAAAAAAAAAEAAAAPPPLPTYGGATGANSAQPKKRKRPSAAPADTGPRVTADNVVDLWERVIEKKKMEKTGKTGKTGKKEKKEKKEKKATAHQDEASSSGNTKTDEAVQPPARNAGDGDDAPKSAKRQKKQQQQQQQQHETPRADKKEEPARASLPKPEGSKKKAKTQDARASRTETAEMPAPAPAAHGEKSVKKDKKGKKEENKPDNNNEETAAAPPTKVAKVSKAAKASLAAAPAAAPPAALVLPPPPPALTPLQAAMRAKLVSARFRHLNETLYTSPSAEALRLFADAPDMFQAYHEGFRQQVAVWPENPVDGYIAEVRRRAGGGSKPVRSGGGRGGRGGRGGSGGGRGGYFHDPTDTLPRTRGTCTIADIGCGDARLAAALAPDAARLRVAVLSYDLHADPRTTPHITAAADAAALPLAMGSVDVAVFCLALMGTNWLAFVEEAYRVLRWKGELWVAEIKSRFAGAAELRARQKQLLGGGKSGGRAAGQPVSHSVGYRRKMGGGKPKQGKEEEDDPDVVAAALAEVDGDAESGSGGTTDVSAFVRALQRRGFVLDEAPEQQQSEDAAATRRKGAGKPPAVDFSNKMFVKMRFIKGAPATVGKEEVMEALEAMGHGSGGKKKPLKFIDGEGADRKTDPMADPALEAKILKPCVYKLR